LILTPHIYPLVVLLWLAAAEEQCQEEEERKRLAEEEKEKQRVLLQIQQERAEKTWKAKEVKAAIKVSFL
jgi:hypothetical protein